MLSPDLATLSTPEAAEKSSISSWLLGHGVELLATTDAVLRCSMGCARHSHYAVGPAWLVGGPCLCGDLPTVAWRRDAEGLTGLRARSLRSLT